MSLVTVTTTSADSDRVQCEANYVAAIESLKCPQFPEEFKGR